MRHPITGFQVSALNTHEDAISAPSGFRQVEPQHEPRHMQPG